MCRTLLHEIGREQPKTTKELLDITTRHAFGEEAVGAAFILGNVGAVANGGQATPTKATVKSARKGGKAEKRGRSADPLRCHSGQQWQWR
jgi:hypothetical protein